MEESTAISLFKYTRREVGHRFNRSVAQMRELEGRFNYGLQEIGQERLKWIRVEKDGFIYIGQVTVGTETCHGKGICIFDDGALHEGWF